MEKRFVIATISTLFLWGIFRRIVGVHREEGTRGRTHIISCSLCLQFSFGVQLTLCVCVCMCVMK